MKEVFKCRIDITAEPNVTAPSDIEVIHIAEQNGALVLWGIVEVDDIGSNTYEQSDLRLCIRGTGRVFTGNEGKHIATVQMPTGLVLHIFWRL